MKEIRKTIALILILTLSIGLMSDLRGKSPIVRATTGTIKDFSDYEEIAKPEDLDKLSYVVDGKYYLSSDIDMSKYNGTYEPVKGFHGVLDGNGHTISNLKNAVIDTITGSAEVRDLKLINCTNEEGGYYYSGDYCRGCLVNCIEADNANIVMKDISITANPGTGFSFGGLCGFLNVGDKTDVEIKSVDVNFKRKGSSSYTGGFITEFFNSSGGLISEFNSSSDSFVEISDCIVQGEIKRCYYPHVGGVVAECSCSSGVDIKGCYTKLLVDEDGYVGAGGIIGSTSASCTITIDSCIVDNYLNGSYAGGFIGCLEGSATITNSVCLDEKINGKSACGATVGDIGSYGSLTTDKVFYYNKLYDEKNRTYVKDSNATALSAMQLTEESSFSGLNFEDVFDCVPGVNRGRIILKKLASYMKTDSPTIEIASQTETTKTISMSSDCPDAVIYYTTNGKKATTSATKYTGPITVNTNTHFNAIAAIDGYADSDQTELSATFRVKKPVANYSAGTYDKGISVTLSCATNGAVIYYTTDGSSPTTTSKKYNGTAIKLNDNGTTTVKAVAVKSGWTSSEELSNQYKIKITVTKSSGSGSSSVTKPAKVKGVKVKKKKNKFTVKWKKVKGAKGYEVQAVRGYFYRRSVGWTKVKVKTTSKTSLKNKKISWGDYSGPAPMDFCIQKVRVRAYKIVGGKKVYGKYSTWKTVVSKKKAKYLMGA